MKEKTCKKRKNVTIEGEGEFGCFVCLWQKHSHLQAENELLKVENKKIKGKADEVFRHTMWLATEFGKVLEERAELQKELKALREKP